MDRVSLLWRLRRRARRGALCMAFFCIAMALLYAICAENSVPVTDAIFGVRARTRAQPRSHSVIKVCDRSDKNTQGCLTHTHTHTDSDPVCIDPQVLRGGAKPVYTDPQKLPGIIPGDPHRPIPVLSSLNHTLESWEPPSKQKPRERPPAGFLSGLLPRPFTRALETLFGGRRKGELSGRGDAEAVRTSGDPEGGVG
ncbi:unnamed protein product [Tetraodon nigroviridis]|uniref:(spotted green pufferfish) hypothetical protein n=1 Tax=Tetraodon nigroviridis TaxID=99883 RepID=Q4SPU5_TETNG|nr:unnamed protein product [Tetraodon nigroviridis]